MARFRDLSIRSKLMTGFMLTSLVALLITMAALALYDRETFKQVTSQQALDLLRRALGQNAKNRSSKPQLGIFRRKSGPSQPGQEKRKRKPKN